MQISTAFLPSIEKPAATGLPGMPSQASSKVIGDRRLQSIFSEVLQEVGREGFVSVSPLESEKPLAEEVASGWDSWFNEFGASRYDFRFSKESPSVRENKSAEDLRNDYREILVNAYRQGGYATPKRFLEKLSSDELAAIQQVQNLADPINVFNLSEEASLNLLLPPVAQVDENRDGLTAVGAGYTLRFPSSNTPTHVRDAWEVATSDMADEDKMHYQLQMLLPIVTANLQVDDHGQFIRSSQPGDADWKNPMSSPAFDYMSVADKWIDYLEDFKSQIPVEQYQRDQNFWQSFRESLHESNRRKTVR